MKRIRLNDPDDGDWIMTHVGGAFDSARDRCIANTRDGDIVGGFAFQNFTGVHGSIVAHMAGEDARWCSRDLLWMCFDYCFNQLGVHKIIAPVPGFAITALIQNTRAGYVPEAMIEHAFPDGSHLVMLSMTRDQCRWLKPRGVHYRRGYVRVEMVNG